MYNKLVAELVMGRVCMGRVGHGPSLLWAEMSSYLCYHGNQWLDLAEFQTHSSSNVCYHYLQVRKDSDQEQLRKSGDIFSHYKPMGIFFRRSRAANSEVSGPLRPKFELVRALMHVIVTCKYEKERMKNS